MPPPPPKKPLQPIENPFPEKKEFRLGQYRVIEERDDYLICTGFDPNAKNPASEVTPSAFRSGALMKVAKPPALQRTAWDGKTVEIGGTEYTYEYSDAETGLRTVTDEDDNEEEQRIDPPYIVEGVDGQIIVAVQIKKNAAVDGMEFTDEEGTRLRWIDLNVSGRHWKSPASGGGQVDVTGVAGAFSTIVEYEPNTGAIIHTYDRGKGRTTAGVYDAGVIYTSGGKVFGIGTTESALNSDGLAMLWDADSREKLWYSERGGLSAVTQPNIVSGFLSVPYVHEAGDGFLWASGVGGTYRIDPSDGSVTHRVAVGGGGQGWLLPCPTSGSVIQALGTPGASTTLSIINSSGTTTHNYTPANPNIQDADVAAGVIVVLRNTNGNLTSLDASDLTVISDNAIANAPRSICTDGSTIWVICNTGDPTIIDIRAFDVTDTATELWSANRGMSGNACLKYNPIDGDIYEAFGTSIRRLDSSNGSVVWTANSLVASHKTAIGFGSDFIIVAGNSAAKNVFCLEASTGAVRWYDYINGGVNYATGVFVTNDDRVFVSSARATV